MSSCATTPRRALTQGCVAQAAMPSGGMRAVGRLMASWATVPAAPLPRALRLIALHPHHTASLSQVVEALLASLTATGKEGKLKVSRAALICAGVSVGLSVATNWLETHSCAAAALGHQSKRSCKRSRRCDLPLSLARAPDRLHHSPTPPDPPLPSTCLAGL